jgi:hypothetical protein
VLQDSRIRIPASENVTPVTGTGIYKLVLDPKDFYCTKCPEDSWAMGYGQLTRWKVIMIHVQEFMSLFQYQKTFVVSNILKIPGRLGYDQLEKPYHHRARLY